MRILRVMPLAAGLAVAALAHAGPASADTVFGFNQPSEYRDSISINQWSRRSNLGATVRERSDDGLTPRERASSRKAGRGSERLSRAERRERARAARFESGDEETTPVPRSRRRGARVASLGTDYVSGGGGGSHGIASYYWQPQRVASGGWFNPNAMTAAHKTLPFGTRVRVTHAGNGRSVIVRINDRGPFVRGRVIDLSRAAASVIGMTGQGLARIRMEILGR
jgi:rare lipoprotein A